MKKEFAIKIMGGVLLLSVLLTIRPLKISNSDSVVKEAADYAISIYEPDQGLMMSHTLLFYYLNDFDSNIRSKAFKTTFTNLDQLQSGSLIIWDSHYSYKPRLNSDSIPLSHFLENSELYEEISDPFVSENKVMTVHFFRVK